MQLKTILNRVQKHQCFVYSQMCLLEKDKQLILEINLEARANSRPVCSGCDKRGPGYDTLPSRHFEFIPLRPSVLMKYAGVSGTST